MARKSKKQEVEDPVQEHEEVEQTSEAEEAPSKKSKRSKSKKEKKSKSKSKKDKSSSKKSKKSKKSKTDATEAAPAESETTSEAPATETKATPADDVSELETLQGETNAMFKEAVESITERRDVVKEILAVVRNLQRQVNRERKETAKVLKKLAKTQRKKRRGGNKAPGGFTKPTPLSEPMCQFLEVESGTELPRTEVTRRVNQYVKDHSLQNPENKKIILPDAKLKGLLYLSDDDELTYFNLQSFMKIHFLKRDAKTGEIAAFAPPEQTA